MLLDFWASAGEGHADGLSRIIDELVAEHCARGTLRRGDGPCVPPPATPSVLRYPGKIVWRAETGSYLVSDSGNHSVVELDTDGATGRPPGRARDAAPDHRAGPADAAAIARTGAYRFRILAGAPTRLPLVLRGMADCPTPESPAPRAASRPIRGRGRRVPHPARGSCVRPCPDKAGRSAS